MHTLCAQVCARRHVCDRQSSGELVLLLFTGAGTDLHMLSSGSGFPGTVWDVVGGGVGAPRTMASHF